MHSSFTSLVLLVPLATHVVGHTYSETALLRSTTCSDDGAVQCTNFDSSAGQHACDTDTNGLVASDQVVALLT